MLTRHAIFTSLILSLCLLWSGAWHAEAQTFTYLYTFDTTNYASGFSPTGSLAINGNGVLYGTTQMGGAGIQCLGGSDQGCGTAYSLTPPAAPGGAWTETVLWSFGATSTDAYGPSGVVMGANGVLYGVAGGGELGYGAVFSLTPPINPGGMWTEAVLYRFAGAPDGAFPSPGLAIDENGVLYGTTTEGGTGACLTLGCGTVFALSPPTTSGGNWTETVLWSFAGKGDGAEPRAGVLIGQGGGLYGITQYGGINGAGVVFSLIPPETVGGAWFGAVLYTFPKSDGQHPTSLALGAGGVLYGTTDLQQIGEQGGTAFSLVPPTAPGGTWTRTTLFAFPRRSIEASTSDQPNGPLVLDEKTGALVGATGNGRHGYGTLFVLVPPQAGGAWKQRVVETGHTVDAVLGVKSGGVLYGTDYVFNVVWSFAF